MAKIVLTVFSILAIYWSDLAVVFNEGLFSDLTSYVLILPFLIAYLVYRKRRVLRAAISFDLSNRDVVLDLVEGTAVMAAALTFYWISSFSTYALSYRIITLPFFAIAAVFSLFGRNTARGILFPASLTLFLTPLPAELTAYLGGVLSLYTTTASVSIVQLFGVGTRTVIQYGNPVVQYASLAGGPVAFAVSIQCSGLYSLTGFTSFAAFAAYLPKGRILAKITLFALGFALVYALNIVRVTSILMIGWFYGQGAALTVYHDLAGSIFIFLGTLAILILGEKVWKLKFRSNPTTISKCTHDDSHLDILGGFCSLCGAFVRFPRQAIRGLEAAAPMILVALTVIMILAEAPLFVYAQGPNPNTFSLPSGNVAPPNLLPTVSTTNGNWVPSFQFRDFNFENLLTAQYIHAAWIFAYDSANTSLRYPITVGIEVAPVLRFLDHPEVSLFYVQSPYHVSGSITALRDSPIPGTPLIGRILTYTAATQPGVNHVVYYWYERATFRKDQSFVNDYMLITLHTTGDQLASDKLIIDPTSSVQIENALLPFAQTIVNYWEPVKSASVLAEFLATNSRTWTPIISGFILAGLAFSGYLEISRLNSADELGRIIGRLQTVEDRRVLRVIYRVDEGLTGEEAHKLLWPRISSKNAAWLLDKLTSAESLLLVRRRLRLSDENPEQVWSRPRVRFWNRNRLDASVLK